jgi:hypothetical protein
VEWIRDDPIGTVKEVHLFQTARPPDYFPNVADQQQALQRIYERIPVPPEVKWDLWPGPAPERPYHPMYLPRKWRLGSISAREFWAIADRIISIWSCGLSNSGCRKPSRRKPTLSGIQERFGKRSRTAPWSRHLPGEWQAAGTGAHVALL